MARAKSKSWPDILGPTPPAGESHLPCGQCMTGYHDACIVSIWSVLTNITYVCNCRHEEEE